MSDLRWRNRGTGLGGRVVVPLLAAFAFALPASASAASTWVAANVPLTRLNPAAGTSPGEALTAVSCPASGSCYALGSYSDDTGSREGLIETLAGGKLTASTAPLAGLSPAGGSNPQIGIFSMDCPVAGWCVAVGDYKDTSGNTDLLSETLSDGAWSAATLPLTGLNPTANPSIGIGLNKVTCAGEQVCTAVGAYNATSGASPQGLIEQLSASGWKATTAPLTGLNGTEDQLNDVSCASASSCAAVGITDGGDGDLVETLSGTAWAPSSPSLGGLTPPAVTNPFTHQPGGGDLTNVSCPSSGACTEVGTYEDNADGTLGLLVSGSQTKAVDLTAIKPAAGTNPIFAFAGLACGTACTGLGDYTTSASGRIASVTRLSSGGATTTAVSLAALSPAAASPPSVTLQDLSCPSTSNCVGVGQYLDNQEDERGIVETITTSTTATTPLLSSLKPAPASNPGSTLAKVACPPSGPCLAIGSYIDASSQLHAMLASPAPANTITRLSPAAGPTAGGQTVTIHGTGFKAGAHVFFGSGAEASSVTVVSSTELRAVTPAHAAGLVNVRVISNSGTSPVTGHDKYTYGPPAVSAVSPHSGSASGGQTVTITGSGFVPGSHVVFGAGASATTVTFVTRDQLTAVSPAHAAGVVNVRVITPGGPSPISSTDHYTYN
jgi:hypothetical protein